jgi:hypothetical protein
VTAFFIPGVNGDEGRSEDVYRRLRRESKLELGRSPRAQRIFRLWSRRGSVDCLTDVDPTRPAARRHRDRDLRHGRASAIRGLPPPAAREPEPRRHREILECAAYSVLEFDA